MTSAHKADGTDSKPRSRVPDTRHHDVASDRGGERAAVMTLIQTAKLNDVDPQAWLADVLARIADHKITHLADLLPWNWRRRLPAGRAV
jgi:hypothetical protein